VIFRVSSSEDNEMPGDDFALFFRLYVEIIPPFSQPLLLRESFV
jgi:hypothetical protein